MKLVFNFNQDEMCSLKLNPNKTMIILHRDYPTADWVLPCTAPGTHQTAVCLEVSSPRSRGCRSEVEIIENQYKNIYDCIWWLRVLCNSALYNFDYWYYCSYYFIALAG